MLNIRVEYREIIVDGFAFDLYKTIKMKRGFKNGRCIE